MTRRRIAYSEAELRFAESHASMNRKALHAAFVAEFQRADVTCEHIKALCSRYGWATRTAWSTDEDVRLRELYPNTRTEDVARTLGRSVSSTYQRAYTLGLEKSTAYLASPAACRTNGRQGMGSRFPKGHVPANKGKPMPFHPNSAATRFQKGVRQGVAVKLYKPVGTEHVRDGYLVRKIHDGLPLQSRWRAVHLIRWEEIHGPLPKGMVLKCLGTDRQNTDPSNWECIPRAILPRLNGKSGRAFDAAPDELKPTIMAVAKLEHAAMKRRVSA